MMISDEEKRWIVVGIAMNKVAAPVLRDAVKQGMDTNFAHLDRHCQHLTPSCTLRTLTHGLVRADPIFGRLKFQNINNNHLVHGTCIHNYNFNINSSADLAKLYLPDYLAQFSAFDDSLDMTAILRLLGFKNYKPAAVFSPHTQASADDVRENVRNKWGHVDVTVWTNALFNDCFDKLKTLLRSLGLTASVEKNTLDQLDDWQMKGCQLIMGHAVDRDLLHLVQDEVRDLIKDYNTIESQLNLRSKQVVKVEEDVAILKDQDKCKEMRLDEHHERLDALEESLLEAPEYRSEEIKKVLEKLVSFEVQLSIRLETVEEKVDQLGQSQTKTDVRVEQLEQTQTETVDEVEFLKHSHTRTADEVKQLMHRHTKIADQVELMKHSHTKIAGEVEQMKHSHTGTATKVDQLDQRCTEVEQIGQKLKTQSCKPEASSMKPFVLNSCRSKLEDHYQKTATVPTSVWCKKSVVDIHQIYTRLSWVKEEQTAAGTIQSGLKHYSDLFTANKNGVIPKRILVQGQTGIGKSTFVKKLLVDWVEANKKTGDDQTAVLKNFELVVAVNLKEVSKCQSLRDVIRLSNVFAKEDKYMTEGLVDYITNNQEKILLIFDGYDEYRSGRNSEIYEIFSGNSLRSCCVLITARNSKADELRGSEDLHAEITGFSEVDIYDFMRRFLRSNDEVSELKHHLHVRNLDKLAKVPLLLLCFCILWRQGQLNFSKSKTKLYTDIIQFIINHSHGKQLSPRYVELASSKPEILSEIGKVALQGLLNDDYLFEYSQLPDSVRSDESVIIGLLQITEYSETLRPVGMVSFIHKSIQEFLAAWYVTYRCIPEGRNLSEIGVTLEECLALENVFQFICGLSEDGALLAFSHLKSVRISDPSLDLSKAIPDVEGETDVPLSDVTDRQMKFSELVFESFEEVKSRTELSGTCLDCLGSILLCDTIRSLPEEILLKLKDRNSWYLIFEGRSWGSLWYMDVVASALDEVVKVLVSERSDILNVADFLQTFQNTRHRCSCGFHSILCFRNDQVCFYITDLRLSCENHIRRLINNVFPCRSEHLSSGQLSLKFLNTLHWCMGPLMEGQGAFISDDLLCHLLREQIPNPRGCSLSIRCCALTSKGAVELATLLQRFENVIHLEFFRLAECSTEAVTRLVAAIKHVTLEELELSKIHLTSAAAEALCQSLPELSALRTLKIIGLVQLPEEAVTKLVAAIKHKTLEELELSEMNLTSAAAEALCQWLPELSALQTLRIGGLNECSDEAVTKLVAAIKHKTLEELELSEMNLTSAVVEGLGQSLPELSALQTLRISGSGGCSLQLQFPVYNGQLRTLEISGFPECSAEAVLGLFGVFKHTTRETETE